MYYFRISLQLVHYLGVKGCDISVYFQMVKIKGEREKDLYYEKKNNKNV